MPRYQMKVDDVVLKGSAIDRTEAILEVFEKKEKMDNMAVRIFDTQNRSWGSNEVVNHRWFRKYGNKGENRAVRRDIIGWTARVYDTYFKR